MFDLFVKILLVEISNIFENIKDGKVWCTTLCEGVVSHNIKLILLFLIIINLHVFFTLEKFKESYLDFLLNKILKHCNVVISIKIC